jgi:hypothetical protein
MKKIKAALKAARDTGLTVHILGSWLLCEPDPTDEQKAALVKLAKAMTEAK